MAGGGLGEGIPVARGDLHDRREAALARLAEVKAPLLEASDRAARELRSCAGCDAHCCRAGCNSMRVSRLEALALARRLSEPDLAPRVPEILRRAREEIRLRGLCADSDATYDCPLLSGEGRCLVHGPAQPSGCLTFRPVPDGGCDHDLRLFHRHYGKVERLDRRVFGRRSRPLPIPLALVNVLPLHRAVR